MPNITTCQKCCKCYEEVSEEMANSPERLCRSCYEKHGVPLVSDQKMEALCLLILDEQTRSK